MTHGQLAPVLQREIDELVTQQGRHAIATELRRILGYMRANRKAPDFYIAPSGGRLPTVKASWAEAYSNQADVLREFAEVYFPREHGRACLAGCGRRVARGWLCSVHEHYDRPGRY